MANEVSIINVVASRYQMKAGHLLPTLRATAFKGDKPVSDEQMMALLVVANQYKLNPFTREIYAFPDKRGGIVPVVSVDGWDRIINEHPMLDGFSFIWDPKEQAQTCTMWRKDRNHPIEVTEYMDECRRPNSDAWKTHPRRMLRHKAFIQCARLAFGFAGIYDEDEAKRIAEARQHAANDEPAGASSADKVRSILTPAAEVTDVEPREPTPAAAEPSDDGPTPKTLGELLQDLTEAPDADAAALVLDEARHHLTPAEHLELESAFLARWVHGEDEKEL